MKLSDLAKSLPAIGAFMGIKSSIFFDMTKIRELGFKSYISTEKSFTKAFDILRKHKYIP